MKMTVSRSKKGFTLIELIGVMAIMAILASVVTPTAVRAIERAAINTERQNLKRVGEMVRDFTKASGRPPNSGNWLTELAPYTDMNTQQLLRNSRNNNRVFLVDPASSPGTRVILLSNMRGVGLAIPTTANTAQFQAIWDTAEGAVPATSGWTGWVRSFDAPDAPNSIENVVIERINLSPEMRTMNLTLNNSSAPVDYKVFDLDGTMKISGRVGVSSTPLFNIPTISITPRIGQRCVLYNTAGAINYTYIPTGTNVSMQFDGTNWKIP